MSHQTDSISMQFWTKKTWNDLRLLVVFPRTKNSFFRLRVCVGVSEFILCNVLAVCVCVHSPIPFSYAIHFFFKYLNNISHFSFKINLLLITKWTWCPRGSRHPQRGSKEELESRDAPLDQMKLSLQFKPFNPAENIHLDVVRWETVNYFPSALPMMSTCPISVCLTKCP